MAVLMMAHSAFKSAPPKARIVTGSYDRNSIASVAACRIMRASREVMR